MDEATARPWHATTIGSHDQKHAAAKAFLAVMAVRADNPDIEFSDTTWIRNADDSLEVALVGNGPKQTQNGALIVEAVNAYDRLRAIEAAARTLVALLAVPMTPKSRRDAAIARLRAALEVPSDAR